VRQAWDKCRVRVCNTVGASFLIYDCCTTSSSIKGEGQRFFQSPKLANVFIAAECIVMYGNGNQMRRQRHCRILLHCLAVFAAAYCVYSMMPRSTSLMPGQANVRVPCAILLFGVQTHHLNCTSSTHYARRAIRKMMLSQDGASEGTSTTTQGASLLTCQKLYHRIPLSGLDSTGPCSCAQSDEALLQSGTCDAPI